MQKIAVKLSPLVMVLLLFFDQPTAMRAAIPSENDNAPRWVVTRVVQANGLQHRTFDSTVVKTKVSYFIYVPESYDAAKERRFPVLYWLHGTGGVLRALPELAAYFDAAIRSGKTPPMLVVFPNGLESWWCDSKDGKVPMETIVVRDFLPHIDATFRTVASRSGRLIEGFSMGGYGAARLGFKYPELFGAVSLIASAPLYLDITNPPPGGNAQYQAKILRAVYGGDPEYFKALSPWVLAEKNVSAIRGVLPIRLFVGERDFGLGITRGFEAHLAKLNIPHTFTVLPGVNHDAMAVLNAIGEANWKFYQAVFGPGK